MRSRPRQSIAGFQVSINCRFWVSTEFDVGEFSHDDVGVMVMNAQVCGAPPVRYAPRGNADCHLCARTARVVVALDGDDEREPDNRQKDGAERASQGCRAPRSARIARTMRSEISASTLQLSGSM